MSVFKSRLARVIVPLAGAALVCGVAGGVIAATSSSPDSSAFLVSDFLVPAVPAGGDLAQPLAGLWFGTTATSYTKVAGADWLSVDSDGVVTGTAPASAPASPATITVQASEGGVTSRITLEVPVRATGVAPRIEAASWNLDEAGSNASWSAVQKELRAIVAGDIQVVGVQESGGTAAAEIAKDLGWHYYQADAATSGGDLGLISAYPISGLVPPTAATPAVGATLDVDGQDVRVWTAHLDETGYGPEAACLGGESAAQLVSAEKASVRYAQATAIAAEMAPDLTAAATATGAPVVLLGDLASPAASDWTAATSASHCDAGAVDWPVPDVFTAAGLTDSYRAAFPDAAAHPGATWSPTVTTDADGRPEPQDRIDYVDYAGHLSVVGAESLYTGWVSSASGDASTTWPSDHAAAVTMFQLGSTTSGSTPGSTGGSTAHGTVPDTTGPATSGTGSAGSTAERLQQATPRITGHAKVGAKLTVRHGSWAQRPRFSYQWYAGRRAVEGATHAVFRPSRAQRGKRITVRVTAHKAGYATVTVVSGTTGRVK
jgi:hypothetical protein